MKLSILKVNVNKETFDITSMRRGNKLVNVSKK